MAAATFTVGQPAGFTVSTSAPKAQLTEMGSVPAGLTFKVTRSGAMLSGRPASGTGGVHDIALAARDQGGRAAQMLTLTILQAPQFATSHPGISATGGVPTSTSFAVTGYPAVTISESGALPAGLHFMALGNGTAVISGTPPVGGMSQSNAITLTAQNAAGAVKDVISLTVAQPAPPMMAPPMAPVRPPMVPSPPPTMGSSGMG